jgi:hypothetical protein
LHWHTQHHRVERNAHSKNDVNGNDDDKIMMMTMINDIASFPTAALNRRHFLAATAVGSWSFFILPTLPAHAGALLQFPVGKETQLLKNKYHFMRAGLSDLEASGIYSTNALFLTNRENAMNDKGQRLVLQALESFKRSSDREEENFYPTIAYHSLAANGMDTGDLIARELKLGREKLLPEFTYLDQRGIGLWDASAEALVKPAIWALDYLEAGKFGISEKSRPPANNDGTPNETLGDAFVRLRQFLSLQESRTSGETILVIFPDGTGPALLSCMIAGIPFRDVHALEFRPGELRLDITPDSVRALFEVRKDDAEYLAILQDGKEKLALLRQQQKEQGSRAFVGLKEQMAEQERLEIDEAFESKKRTDATRERERQRVVQEAYETKKRTDETREKERLRAIQVAQQAREQKERRRREEKERERNERAAIAAAASSSASLAEKSSSNNGGSLESGSSTPVMGAAAVGLLGVVAAMVSSGGGNDNKEDENEDRTVKASFSTTVNMESISTTSVANVKAEETIQSPPAKPSSLYTRNTANLPPPGSPPRDTERTSTVCRNGATNTSTTTSEFSLTEEDVVDESSLVENDTMIQEQLDQLMAAEQPINVALAAPSAASLSSINNNVDDLVNDDTDEDGDDAWLRVLSEIRDEDDSDDAIVKSEMAREVADDDIDDDFFVNDEANITASDFDLMMINGDGRKPKSRSADL